MITQAERDAAEEQIQALRRIVDYDIHEYPVEVIVAKYADHIEEEKNEFYVPDYQREHVWDEKRQSKFIESVVIGLPVPFLFVADVNDQDGRLEIVDGSQRIRTLASFVKGTLQLSGLKKVTSLNGFHYADLSLARQRKFNRTTIRLIALTDKADEETRRDLFERINTGSDPLTHMEERRGIMGGPFLDLIKQCAKSPLFIELAPLSASSVKRHEDEEFVLRFFAYFDRYESFERSVKDFLDTYVKEKNGDAFDAVAMKARFDNMLSFVKRNFPNGFKKGANHKTTPRIRFEAIAVGVALAQASKADLADHSVADWIDSEEFETVTTSDSSNSKPKVKKRIEFVRDKVLSAS